MPHVIIAGMAGTLTLTAYALNEDDQLALFAALLGAAVDLAAGLLLL